MIEIGSIVRSQAGRDQGRLLAVINLDGDYAAIVDGKVRKLAKPKMKKLRHLGETGILLEPSKITSDKKLKRVLAELGRNTKDSGGGIFTCQKKT